jgi:RHS repeat-associated protein
MGRRVEKKVYDYTAGSWILTSDSFFVYDGWNLISELSALSSPPSVQKYYVCGLDLSQSLQGAGGIGGLIASVDTGTNKMYYYLYDANGNVGQLIDSVDGSLTAHYEYDPYGNITVKSGSYADANPYRFSSKYFDQETGLLYYGYRFYAAALGRWINRDPLGEEGGINLYGFVGNNPANEIDPLGLKHWSPGLGMYLPDPGDELVDKCPRGPKPDPCAPLLPPDIPPGANVDQNILSAEGMNDPVWFYNQVKNKGPWDYKQQGPQYQPFGNFNFGAAGMGISTLSPQILQRGAGWAQGRAGTSQPGWGKWWRGYPYGDDPIDQYWIQRGIAYYKCRKMIP